MRTYSLLSIFLPFVSFSLARSFLQSYKSLLLGLLLSLVCLAPMLTFAAQLERISGAEALNTVWAMDRIDQDRVVFTQREGRLASLSLSTNKIATIDLAELHSQIVFGGQGGLLDVLVLNSAVSKQLKTSDQVHLLLSFSKHNRSGICVSVVRATLVNQRLRDIESVFDSQCGSDKQRHFGGRLAIIKGKLFITIGDGGNRDQAQNLANHAGTIVRLNLDGSTPKDNPFVTSHGALPQIYSYGHRNPQGLAYIESDQRMYAIEHGPRGGDELNHILAGANYGWPKYSYGKEYWGPVAVGKTGPAPGFKEPVWTYTPSIAPADLAYEAKSQTLFIPALRAKNLSRLALGVKSELSSVESLLPDKGMRLRSVLLLGDGRLLIGTDQQGIYLLRP